MAVEKIERSIMVDLDSILDTRLSLLFKLNKNALPGIIVEGYKHRVLNQFKDIDKGEWDKEWSNRGVELLGNALATNIPKLIGLYTGLSGLVDVKTPVESAKSIIINTHPYELTSDICRMIAGGFLASMGTEVTVEFTHKEPKDIGPSWMYDNISVYICYNGLDYLRYHIESKVFLDEYCPSTILVCPAILEDLPQSETPASIFHQLTEMMSMFIALEFIPVEHFCGILGPDIDKEVKKISDELDKRAT